MKSIISDERRCYLCGSTVGLEEHHILFGTSHRKVSERLGLKVWLCYRCHRDNKYGVHGNRAKDRQLKELAQSVFEKNHTRDEWLKLFGRNYLD